MNLCVHEHIVVEDDSFERNEEQVGYGVDNRSFGGVSALSAILAQAVRYDLSSVHSLQGCIQVVLSLDVDTVGEESFLSLTFLSACRADHLRGLGALEDFFKQVLD